MKQLEKETLPVILSNLKKAAEKQQKSELTELFGRLSSDYDKGLSDVKDFSGLKTLIEADLADKYKELQVVAESAGDRGTLRAIRWGEKVTAIQKSLINRYASKGEAVLEGKNLYVCEACGFIFLGDNVPEICPVCKAPASRFTKV